MKLLKQSQSVRGETGRFLEVLELGLLAGMEPRMCLEWFSTVERISLLDSFLETCRKADYSSALKQFAKESQSPSWKLIFELLQLIASGVPRPSELVKQSAVLLRTFEKLESELRSSLFLPRFQMGIAILVCLLFAFAIPALSDGMVPSFLDLGRLDLFLSAMAVMGLGVWQMHRFSRRPYEAVRDTKPLIYFFRYLSVFLQAGQDPSTAWRSAHALVDFPPKISLILSRDVKSAEAWPDFLQRIQAHPQLPKSIRESLVSILWAAKSGSQLSVFFSQLSIRQAEVLDQVWQGENEKMAALTLIPMAIFVMPASLFLLLGPQVMELTR